MDWKIFGKVTSKLLWIMAVAFVVSLTISQASADGLTKGDGGKGTGVPDVGVLQQSGVLAYNPSANNYLVLWQDNDTPTGSYDIYGRLVSSTGSLIDSPIAIGIGSGDQKHPAIAYNASTGEYLVVWEDFRSGSHWQVYGQRVAANGSLIGSNYLASSSPADAEQPSLAYNSTDHGYMVAWQDNRTSALFDIYVRVLSDIGAPTGSATSVWATLNYDDQAPVIAYNPGSNRYLVVWEMLASSPGADWDIVSSALNIDGTVASAKVPIGSAPNIQLGPSLAYNPVNNQMLVVWHDWRSGTSNIWGAMVSSTGSLQGNAFALYTGPNFQVWPQVAYSNHAAVYVVAWQDFRNSSNYDIYARTVGYNGVVSAEFPISTLADHQEAPQIASNSSNNELLVTWDDARNDIADIYAQRITSSALLGSDFKIAPADCTLGFTDVPPGSTFYPEIACLVCHGIVSGYADDTFRPGNPVTRGQLAKIVANSAGFNDAPGAQMFEDVPSGSTFFEYVQRLANRGFVSGYPCGGPGEPCGPGSLMYFRPGANASRGQISKIVARARGYEDNLSNHTFQDVPVGSTFHKWIENLATRGIMSGYPCGSAGEPCVPPGNLPYFRPNNNATRGQVSKIVSRTFLPSCGN